MINMEKALAWGNTQVGKIKYSMYGSRYCTDGTCDCSGFVYRMLREGGAKPFGYIPSTETLHSFLLANGFTLHAENKSWQMKRGDVVIWGKRGFSAGANGHTGICLDNQNWIECTAFNDLGVTIQNHDQRLAMNGFPYWYVYRLAGNQETLAKPTQKPQAPNPSSHDQAVLKSPVIHQGNAYGKLEYYNMPSKGILEVRGWLVPDKPRGPIGSQACVILWDIDAKKEVTRQMVPCGRRPDVKKAYGYQGGDHLGYSAKINVSWIHGKRVVPILRRCNKSNGEDPVNDVKFDIFFTIP